MSAGCIFKAGDVGSLSEQLEAEIAMGPRPQRDRRAINEWMRQHVSSEVGVAFLRQCVAGIGQPTKNPPWEG